MTVSITFNQLKESNSCKLKVTTDYLNEVLALSPIVNPIHLTDEKCYAEINHRSQNGGAAFHIQAFDELEGAYCKSEESTSIIFIRVSCRVSWRGFTNLQVVINNRINI